MIMCYNNNSDNNPQLLEKYERRYCKRNRIIANEQTERVQKEITRTQVVNQIVMEQACRSNRKNSTAYIDYGKAYDSVPHSWSVKELGIYKIDPKAITRTS